MGKAGEPLRFLAPILRKPGLKSSDQEIEVEVKDGILAKANLNDSNVLHNSPNFPVDEMS